MSIVYNPSAAYEQSPSIGGTCPPKTGFLAATLSAGQTLVGAVTGKRIAITWMQAKSGGATASVMVLNSNTTALTTFISLPLDSASPLFLPPVLGHLYWITSPGQALKVDVSAAAANFTFGYIEIV